MNSLDHLKAKIALSFGLSLGAHPQVYVHGPFLSPGLYAGGMVIYFNVIPSCCYGFSFRPFK